MADLPLDLEYYPRNSPEMREKARKLIAENKKHWEDPFFMDVYKYADISEFKKVCEPYLQDEKLKNIIILGTGGSYQTMKGLELFSKKKIHFLTSSRPYELTETLEQTTPEDSVVIPISRGGKTLDINSVLPLFKDYKILALSSRGPMRKMVDIMDATILDVPDLSGRFAASVCSVALVPMILAEMDVEKFQKGLDETYTILNNLDTENNPALEYALFLYQLYPKGYRNIFSLPYSIWLEGMVGLFVQEISESSGKEGNGFLGTSQAAPVAQHSVLELLLGGSKGHTTPLLWTTSIDPRDKNLAALGEINSELKDKSGLDVINYQLDATFQALLEQSIPSAKITLNELSLKSMGQMIAFIQTTVYYYCLLTDVNWSSNPKVNIGKAICNEAIEQNLTLEQRIEARKKIANEKFSK